MSDESNFGVSISRIHKPFTQFLKRDSSSSIYNQSTPDYKSVYGSEIAYTVINGQKRYVMTVSNQSFYDETSTSPMTHTLFYSNNGKDWFPSANNLLNYSANGVTWCGFLNKFFACGFGKNGDTRTMVVSSSDGITWIPSYAQNVVSTTTFNMIVSSNDKIVIGNSSTEYYSMYSTNGITWLNTSIGGGCYALAWGNNLWTANVNLNFYWSADGITWVTENQSPLFLAFKMAYDGTIWVAVGTGVLNMPTTLTSDDGKTWNYQGDNKNARFALGYNNNTWLTYAIDYDNQNRLVLQSSTDKGLTWTTIADLNFGGSCILWDGEKWVMSGDGGAIITSGSVRHTRSPLTIYYDNLSNVWTTHDLPDQTACNLFLLEKQVKAYENDTSFGSFM